MDAAIRDYVRQRAGGRCEYCLLPEEADAWPFHLEHIIAKQHGGQEVESNLCWACSRCNLNKGPNIASLDGAIEELVPLFILAKRHGAIISKFANHELWA